MIKKIILSAAMLCFSTGLIPAQSRIFKEVNKQIKSKVKLIQQDEALVGYVIFTQLEKTSADSFNYKLSIMDENLNDIGSYIFKDQNLEIQEVSFEQDVLCVGYLRSDAPDHVTLLTLNKVSKNTKSSIYLQFLSLEGKMINEQSEPIKLILDGYFPMGKAGTASLPFKGSLKNSLRLQNIPGQGFAYTYGDGEREVLIGIVPWWTTEKKLTVESEEKVSVFNLKGEQVWNQTLPQSKAQDLKILVSKNNIYILRKNAAKISDAGYEIICLDVKDGTIQKQYDLIDNKGNSFKVLHFGNDLANGTPRISGTILNTKIAKLLTSKVTHVTKPLYHGVFDVKIKDTVFKQTCSYWSDGSKSSFIDKKSLILKAKAYPMISYSFDDVSGNTYFAGSGVSKKVRWPNIGMAIVTAPTILIPYYLIGKGTNKFKYNNILMLKQDTNGKLSYFASHKCNNSKYFPGRVDVSDTYGYADKPFFSVNENKYLVLNDVKDIFIYDVASKKTLKTIAHKKGKIETNIFRAKEGHIMISEYNTVDRSTKLSIESL